MDADPKACACGRTDFHHAEQCADRDPESDLPYMVRLGKVDGRWCGTVERIDGPMLVQEPVVGKSLQHVLHFLAGFVESEETYGV